MIQHTKRQFSPREQTHLARYAADPLQVTSSTAPVEYLSGKAEFSDFVLEVHESVLIPRIETEELVELVSRYLQQRLTAPEITLRILEVGTGSGAITIALTKLFLTKWAQLQFVASDISDSALSVAKKNTVQILGGNAPIKFVQSDLLENLKTQKFDIIIANLPYIPSNRIATLDDSVKNHEPVLALDGGPSGFELIARLLEESVSILLPKAKIFLEIDHTHSQKNFAAYSKIGWQVELLTDQASYTRFAVLSPPV